ncbi:MAG: pilus assembly protein PilM [Pirellulales bacterium]|nr:pilus assembly protein PilM [Pirellulales bacterium]
MTGPSAPASQPTTAGDKMPDQVPAQAERDSIVPCVRCSQANPTTRRFCESCGAALKLNCFSCGIEVALNERFCGGCGTNLEQAFQDRWMEAHWKALTAWRFSSESRFAEADAEIATIADDDSGDPRFEIFSRMAEIIAPVFSRQWTLAQAAAEHLREEAQTAREQMCMPEVVRAISAIPPALREAAEEIELGQARRNIKELEQLRRQIKGEFDDGGWLSNPENTEDLLESITRALELDTTDAQMNALAEKVRQQNLASAQLDCKRLIQQAKAYVAEHDYSAALRNLESISESVWNERWNAYRSDVRELAWLEQELRQQPFVSTSLLQFARRLLKLSPNDSRAKAWCERLQQRVSRISSGQVSDDEVLWTRQPNVTSLGPSVRLLAGRKSVQLDVQPAQREGKKEIGQLGAAYGVALQGVGLANIEMNLLGKLAKTKRGGIFGKSNKNSACGIDIGSHAVKIVKLSRMGDGLSWDFADVIRHETPLHRLEHPSARHDVMVETLKRACEKRDVSNCRIGISVSGHQSLGRYFKLPETDTGSKNTAKRVQSLIRYEAEAQIPFSLEDVCWDSHIFGQSSAGNVSGKYTQGVALAAVRISDIKQLLGVFGQAKVSPDFAQAECFALYNVLAREPLVNGRQSSSTLDQQQPGKHKKVTAGKTVALIECGAQTTNIVVGSDRHVWMRSFPFAGEEFTRRLARELKVTLERAEIAMQQPWRAKRIHLVANALSPVLREWANEVNRSIIAYRNAHSQSPVSLVLLSGGGSNNFLLSRHIVRKS